MIVPLEARHRDAIADLLARTPEFDADEKSVALELIDDAIVAASRARSPEDYRVFVDEADRANVRGYICFGKTPMTRGTYDLYWIAIDRAHRGAGVGRSLVRRMEDAIALESATLVRVETAGTDDYAATRAFYDRIGYEVIARIRDFYWRGNDLVVYGRYF